VRARAIVAAMILMRRLVSLVLLHGCSFLAVLPSPQPTGLKTFKCNSNSAPNLDVTAAIGLTVVTGISRVLPSFCGDDFDAGRRCDEEGGRGTYAVLGSGAVFVAAAVYGFVANGQCRTKLTKLTERRAHEVRANVLREQEQADSQDRRQRAWERTQAAATAARAGDCALVHTIGIEVHGLDAEFHATVFVRDVAIKKCLDAAVPTQPAPADPERP
jgi:hypothetical protein